MPLTSSRGNATGRLKSFPVKVLTIDAEVEFDVEERYTGKELFDLVCRTLGLREVWYFGLQFTNLRHETLWLKLDKKVLEQDLQRESPISLCLLAKHYPENVEEDLVQDVTRHLFYGQVKQAIISMDVYCPPEAAVLLASYAVQAQLGDFDEATFDSNLLVMEDLLPQRVIDQFSYSSDDWAGQIKMWYSDQVGMTREEAEMEYLKVAQSLDMYGINYFPIKIKKGKEEKDMWLGVKATGLHIYEHDDRLRPEQSFSWADIRDVEYKDKKFSIIIKDKKKKNFVFFSHDPQANKLILELCMGNHDLFMKRRQPDTIEIQQMKIQAKEEKARRKMEREHLERNVREHYEKELHDLREELQATQETMKSQEQAADLLAEKSRIMEEENKLLIQKSSQLENENSRLQMLIERMEEDKHYLESRARKAELFTARLVEDCERRVKENDQLRMELQNSQLTVQSLHEKLMKGLRSSPYSNEMNAEMGYSGYVGVPNDQQLLTNAMNHPVRDQDQYYPTSLSPGSTQNPIQFNYLAQNGPPYSHQSGSPYDQPSTSPYGQMAPDANFHNMYTVGFAGQTYPSDVEYTSDSLHNVEQREYTASTDDSDAATERSREELSSKRREVKENVQELQAEMKALQTYEKTTEESLGGSLDRLNTIGKVPGKAGVVAFFEEL